MHRERRQALHSEDTALPVYRDVCSMARFLTITFFCKKKDKARNYSNQ